MAIALNWQELPKAASAETAAIGIDRWRSAATTDAGGDHLAGVDGILQDRRAGPFLEALFGNSPFLTRCAVSDPGALVEIIAEGPSVFVENVMTDLGQLRHRPPARADLMRILRVARRRIALCVATADITGAWPLERVTAALSAFAIMALRLSVSQLLRGAADQGDIILPHPDDPEVGSGLIVLGMGKLGADELNYSSDIDLILLYDADAVTSNKPDKLQHCFIRLGRDLVTLLSELTPDGYVARVDLRLRPDPGATPVVISVLAAETYYESMGQNWERAAMIKARPVAGDIAAGDKFVQSLQPFIWRKYLDFAAIQDIHSIKRQIYAHHGGAEISIPGHNIKLGRGGIREIEFFAQTQQLIWGGRDPSLRALATCNALSALAAASHISDDIVQELTESYRFLRRVEHRLQMIEDRQTHSLPTVEAGLESVAVFMGFEGATGFDKKLRGHLHSVEAHYAALFEEAPSLGAAGEIAGNLIFTGVDDDPETLTTLAELGFESPKIISAIVRRWHLGRYPALQSDRARQLLTELMPVILNAFGHTPNPDFAFGKFDDALSRLPVGVQLISLFHANPDLLLLVAEVMGSAPRLAAHLGVYPAVLESVLTGDPAAPPLPLEELNAYFTNAVNQADGYEEVLDISRRWANDRKFQVGLHILRSTIPASEAAAALSDVAEASIVGIQPMVEAEFARQHGVIAGGRMSILAMGKLGGREMTPTSDLDLVFIYDHDPGAPPSDGDRSLDPSQYYARLCQRMINAVTALTANGRLYEVDMRLRPSGNSGPIASTVEAFRRYHEEKSWTWEHMALARARIIGPADPLTAQIQAIVDSTLRQERDADRLLTDVTEMRRRIDLEHRTEFVWEVKYVRGGIVDIEFLVQNLQLSNAHQHPEILATNTQQALGRLRDAGLLTTDHAALLLRAHRLWQTVQAMLRLTIEGYFTPERVDEIPAALENALIQACGADTLDSLVAEMKTIAADVHQLVIEVMETPAAALNGSPDEGQAQ